MSIVNYKPSVPSVPPEWDALERIASECSLASMENTVGKFAKAFTLARGVEALRQAITPAMMQDVMSLQGTSLGFRTDKDNGGGYPVHVVKEVFVEATLRGFAPVGNEFNIIAGRFYGTKEGFTARLREFPGLTDLKIVPGVPKMLNGGAIVEVKATWKVDGNGGSLERQIPIRVNANMGADAILGKADRKMKAAIYSLLTGSEMSDGDATEFIDGAKVETPATVSQEPVVASTPAPVPPSAPVEPPVSRTDALAAKLGVVEPAAPAPEPTPATEQPEPAGIGTVPDPWTEEDATQWILETFTPPVGWTPEQAKARISFVLNKRVVVGRTWDKLHHESKQKAYSKWVTNDAFPWE